MGQSFQSHPQWPAVKSVCETLWQGGYEAVLAGGCVRDLIMGRTPNDFDVATNAKPEEVESLFERSITVGRQFGVTILPFEGFQIEVATFRKDGPYKDGRRPEQIYFSSAQEDAQRRDFTVNALFYDLKNAKVIDYVQGEADIRSKLIRAVGDPEHRFDEDKLRILRAFRFAAQLDFSIESKTLEAAAARAAQIKLVSFERIRDELIKLAKSSGVAKGLELIKDAGLFEHIYPEVQPLLWDPSMFRRWQQSASAGATKKSPEGFSTSWALANLVYVPALELSFDIKTVLRRWHCANEQIADLTWLLDERKKLLQNPVSNQAGLIRALGHKRSIFAEAFLKAQGEVTTATEALWAQLHREALSGRRELPERLINGETLKSFGVQPGPRFGDLLEEIFDRQLEGELKTLDDATSWLKKKLS